ncbi:hypothetical protein [Aeromicrobium sp. 179-A 4D2 NHS]|uniref:hypothetical protein n=1 Tax=Aeromicrobium sp. 179-A 4D2 NHS TaxID=3142375 RepID=UPI0039A2E64E
MNTHPHHEGKPVVEVPNPTGAAVDCTDPDGAFHRLLAIAKSGGETGLALTLGDVHWTSKYLEDFGGDTLPVIRVAFDSRTLADGVPTEGVHWQRVLNRRGDGLVLFVTTCCDGAPTLLVDSSYVLADYLTGDGPAPSITIR